MSCCHRFQHIALIAIMYMIMLTVAGCCSLVGTQPHGVHVLVFPPWGKMHTSLFQRILHTVAHYLYNGLQSITPPHVYLRKLLKEGSVFPGGPCYLKLRSEIQVHKQTNDPA